MTLPTDKTARKERPIARGVLDYFPDAVAEVARVSFVGNQQHNPGEAMHWARGKSTDHADCIARHLIDRGKLDDDGMRHSAKAAWRALAQLQLEIEAEQEQQDWEGTVGDGLDLAECDGTTAGVQQAILEDGPAEGLPAATPAASPSASRRALPLERDYLVNALADMGCQTDVADEIVGGVSYPACRITERAAYISGPMRGYPAFNFAAFDTARETLTSEGFAVISPADVDRAAGDFTDGKGFTGDKPASGYAASRRFCYRDFWAIYGLLAAGDSIAVLPGWEASVGATAEVFFGRWLGLTIIDAVTGEPLQNIDQNSLAWSLRDYLTGR